MKSSIRTGLCERILTTKWRRVARGFVVGSGLLVAFFAAVGLAGIRINITPSLPVGLYIATGPQSALIEFCPGGELAALAARRGYRTPGNCPDGASALLKPIVAKYGDVVDFTAKGISVNGRLVRNTAPLAVDTDRRAMQHFPFGRYTVGDEEVWVASSYNPRSFDSRYYGPVAKSAIRGYLCPLLTL
jgi:conjugative transfer signal peptidase TraF